MCGIAGYVGATELSASQLDETLACLEHRGPDNRAVRHWRHGTRNIYLLHTRLNIIDLDHRADQPLQIGTKSISFNGELYNYLEVAADLKREGRAFRTSSDTEVLLTAIDQYGWDGLARCEGMWAFAVYDETDGSLTLSRDRFGEKPLYLHRDETGFYFASEVNALAALVGHCFPPNLTHMFRYMVNGYRTLYKRRETFFEGVDELPAGCCLSISAEGQEHERRYWTFSHRPDEAMSYEQAVEGVRDRVIESVRLRLRSDVPMAFCMSGGVDSNSIISVAKNVFDYDVHGFTIVNKDARYNEDANVEASVRHLGIRHTPIPVRTDGFLERLRDLVRHRAAPVYTISYYAHWLLMESMAEHGYRISVSGTAADELLTGYFEHHPFYLREVSQDPELYAKALTHWETHISPTVRNPILKNPRVFIDNPDERGHLYLDNAFFQSFVFADVLEAFTEEPYSAEMLRNRMLNDLFHDAVPVILHEDDINAMNFSIENRSPFLDRSLFEFCLKIPARHLIQQGRTKAVLRDAMRGIVADQVLDTRLKVGFNAPILSFLELDDPTVRAQLLDDSPIFEHVRKDKIESLTGKRDFTNAESLFLFYFLGCKMLFEEFGS